ncbi:MAG: glycosyltransferase, partial [Flavobacteriaceae bacterium]|nr:glycosyltransferase [Flavobacteriaceae bacterium]
MKIAIVILNWNGKKLLEQFLPAVVSYSKEATIYIADNASTDDSINFVKENHPGITIISNKENGGYAKGYNDALQHIKADVYCLLNSDIEVTKNWLQPVITQFKSDPNIAAIQPKILDYKDKSKFEYAGAAGGFIDKYGYPY